MDKDLLFKEAMRLYGAFLQNPVNVALLGPGQNYYREELFKQCVGEVQGYYHALIE